MGKSDLANPFPRASEAEWRRLVARALGGRPFESLISKSFEGLKIEPLYQASAGEGARALRQKHGAWTISQRMDHPDAETACAMARADLEGGADALTLAVSPAHAARGFGVRIEVERDLDAALAGIDLDRVQLRIDAGPRTPELAAAFAALARARRLTSAALNVDFGHDPVGNLARSGSLAGGPNPREMHARLRDAGFAGHLLAADGRPYHEAGAGEAQELACVIATGVEHMRLLERAGLSLEEARSEIAFLLAADAEEYLCLAKFRALRLLWARIESACGLAPRPVRLHAETAFRMMTRYDPWVNILRTTMGAFCAGVGGADAVTVLPFTLALGLPDQFARRLARNTQLILIHEGKLAKVADPAAGAGSFETLTSELCVRASSLFQNFEAQGGMIAALRAGVPQREIAATDAARRAAIASGRRAITGTSAFPLLGEAPIHVLEVSPVDQRESPAGHDCPPLPSHRDAQPYEVLRAAADAQLRRTGERPRLFLANLGAPHAHAAASANAANFFAAAGIEAVSGEDINSPHDAAKAFRASRCKLACICAHPSLAPRALIEVAQALQGANAARVYLAGPVPEGEEATLCAGGVNEIVCIHRDALAILQHALAIARA